MYPEISEVSPIFFLEPWSRIYPGIYFVFFYGFSKEFSKNSCQNFSSHFCQDSCRNCSRYSPRMFFIIFFQEFHLELQQGARDFNWNFQTGFSKSSSRDASSDSSGYCNRDYFRNYSRNPGTPLQVSTDINYEIAPEIPVAFHPVMPRLISSGIIPRIHTEISPEFYESQFGQYIFRSHDFQSLTVTALAEARGYDQCQGC